MRENLLLQRPGLSTLLHHGGPVCSLLRRSQQAFGSLRADLSATCTARPNCAGRLLPARPSAAVQPAVPSVPGVRDSPACLLSLLLLAASTFAVFFDNKHVPHPLQHPPPTWCADLLGASAASAAVWRAHAAAEQRQLGTTAAVRPAATAVCAPAPVSAAAGLRSAQLRPAAAAAAPGAAAAAAWAGAAHPAAAARQPHWPVLWVCVWPLSGAGGVVAALDGGGGTSGWV